MPRGKVSDLVGLRYSKLVVLSRDNNDHSNNTRWLCQCDCGQTKVVLGTNLKSGAVKSCGCFQKEVNGSWHITHGMSRTPTYRIWDGMIRRCNDPKKPEFKWYGGKGIKVCDKWEKFAGFFEDMGVRPEGLTIDRIDSNGDYGPSNCRWISMKENLRNRSCVILDTEKAEEIRALLDTTKLSQKEIASLFNVDPSIISNIKTSKYWVD